MSYNKEVTVNVLGIRVTYTHKEAIKKIAVAFAISLVAGATITIAGVYLGLKLLL